MESGQRRRNYRYRRQINDWILKRGTVRTAASNNAVPLPYRGSHTGVTRINNCNLLKLAFVTRRSYAKELSV